MAGDDDRYASTNDIRNWQVWKEGELPQVQGICHRCWDYFEGAFRNSPPARLSVSTCLDNMLNGHGDESCRSTFISNGSILRFFSSGCPGSPCHFLRCRVREELKLGVWFAITVDQLWIGYQTLLLLEPFAERTVLSLNERLMSIAASYCSLNSSHTILVSLSKHSFRPCYLVYAIKKQVVLYIVTDSLLTL